MVMDANLRKGRYGHLIKWLIKIGDIIIINTFFFLLLLLFKEKLINSDIILDRNSLIEIFMLLNLSYFIASSIIEDDISLNIVFFDKLLQKTFSFITLYTLLLIVGNSLFNIITLSWVSSLFIYIILGFMHMGWHTFLRSLLKIYRRKGYNYKTVIIIGGGLNGTNVYNELASSVYGYKVLGYFDDNPIPNCTIPSYLGTIVDIEIFCQETKVDEIYCTLPGNQEAKVINLMNFAEKNMIRFFLVPEFYKYIKRKLTLRWLQSMPVISIREEPLQFAYNRALKRTFDILFSSFVLLTIFPFVFIVFGAIIKLTSPGPIFFKQRRTGLEGINFDCYKFRSMRINEDADSIATTKKDPRITKVGSFMRKTSVDELPQFINVLIGNMSVVGPRPHMIQQTALYETLIDKFMIRHLVKPGITGWAQVSGYRGETDTVEKMEGRFKRDVWYIENWSFFLDIKIIFVTILNIFRGEEQAY